MVSSYFVEKIADVFSSKPRQKQSLKIDDKDVSESQFQT
jgi:hypothetical protein